VAQGPVTEELLFRSAAVPLLVRAGMPLTTIIFLTPLVFGLAHIHHFYEFRITHPQVPVSMAVLRSALQLTYTSLFGAYATFLLLRTGSVAAVVLVHTFCNAMGLPRLWGLLYPHWAASEQPVWKWTLAYYFLLVSGMLAWKELLWTLTESTGALVDWG
jgi:prenyl protein peptidase